MQTFNYCTDFQEKILKPKPTIYLLFSQTKATTAPRVQEL